MNFRPIFFFALFLCLGIGFYYITYFNGVSARWILCLLPLAAAPVFVCGIKGDIFNKLLLASLLCAVFFIGFFGFSWQVQRFTAGENRGGEGYVSGRVIEKREYSANSTGLVLDRLEIDGIAEKGQLIAYLPTSSCEEIELSDEVLLYGRVEMQSMLRGQDFQAKRLKSNLRFVVRGESVEITGHKFDLFLLLRARAEKAIEAGMDEEPAAVTQAVLFGNTYAIEEELYDNIRMGGIAHIFAVSGLHIGALFGFCLLIFKKMPLRRLSKSSRFAMLACILLFYAGVCGFSSSVLRATVMCLIAYATKLIGIKSDLLESIGAAAICILLASPASLFEIGFQLSFAACLGIAILTRPIGQVFDEMGNFVKKRFCKPAAEEDEDTKPLGVGEQAYRAVSSFLSVSLAAQIFTAPLLLYYFGYLSGAALLLNCLFVPLIGALFGAVLLLVAIGCILPLSAAGVVLFLPNLLWSVLLLLFAFVDFSAFAITGLRIFAGAFAPYYTACSFCSDKWNLKRRIKILCFFVLTVGMVALTIL